MPRVTPPGSRRQIWWVLASPVSSLLSYRLLLGGPEMNLAAGPGELHQRGTVSSSCPLTGHATFPKLQAACFTMSSLGLFRDSDHTVLDAWCLWSQPQPTSHPRLLSFRAFLLLVAAAPEAWDWAALCHAEPQPLALTHGTAGVAGGRAHERSPLSPSPCSATRPLRIHAPHSRVHGCAFEEFRESRGSRVLLRLQEAFFGIVFPPGRCIPGP